jgi:hypothetical protein
MTTRPIHPPSWPRWVAWGFWLLLFLVIFNDVRRFPLNHTTMPTYRLASTDWWRGLDPYTANPHSGFLYFPQAAVIFTPFNLLPFMAGEFLWRALGFGLFFYALARLNAFFLSNDRFTPATTFLVLSLLAVPSSMASLRNAQFDLPLAALIVLTTAEIASGRWNAATAWLCLAVALKPLALVPLLLFGALYLKLIPRLAVGLLIVIALPFLHWNPAFAAHEYVRSFSTLVWASKGDEARYSDLAALVSRGGYDAPPFLKNVARLLFAFVFLGLGAAGVRRLTPAHAAWLTGALSADYLMLFNPRTETCSYVFLGPFVASLALLYAGQGKNRLLVWGLGFAALGLACDAIPVVHPLTDRWFKPLIALLFLPLLVRFVFEKPAPEKTADVAG